MPLLLQLVVLPCCWCCSRCSQLPLPPDLIHPHLNLPVPPCAVSCVPPSPHPTPPHPTPPPRPSPGGLQTKQHLDTVLQRSAKQLQQMEKHLEYCKKDTADKMQVGRGGQGGCRGSAFRRAGTIAGGAGWGRRGSRVRRAGTADASFGPMGPGLEALGWL